MKKIAKRPVNRIYAIIDDINFGNINDEVLKSKLLKVAKAIKKEQRKKDREIERLKKLSESKLYMLLDKPTFESIIESLSKKNEKIMSDYSTDTVSDKTTIIPSEDSSK